MYFNYIGEEHLGCSNTDATEGGEHCGDPLGRENTALAQRTGRW